MQEKTQRLVDDIMNMMKRDLPIKGSTMSIDIENPKFVPPKESSGYQSEMDLKYSKNGMLAGKIVGTVVMKDKDGKVISKSPTNRKIFDVPVPTDRGTYIVNGTEKHILSQARLNPGSYTNRNRLNGVIQTKINFDIFGDHKRSPNIEVRYDDSKNEFEVIIFSIGENKTVFNGINFLSLIGFSETEIREAIGYKDIADSLFKKYSPTRKTIDELYKAVIGEKSPVDESAALKGINDFWRDNARFGKGTDEVKSNLGVSKPHFDKSMAREAVKKTFSVFANDTKEDDTDDLRFKTIVDDNGYIMEKVSIGWNSFIKQSERLANSNRGEAALKKTNYTELYSLNNIGKTLEKSFASDNLIQNPEETNPLFIASMNNKVTQLGRGGISDASKNSKTSARDTANGSMNRIDPVETPESGNIGFIEHLSQGARIVDGTIKSPVYKVSGGVAQKKKGNEVELSPTEEYSAIVAFYDKKHLSDDGNSIKITSAKIPARYKNEIKEFNKSEIEYIDTAPQNLLGLAANMIPFVNHNDGNRTLMGANMQKQAITLKVDSREAPLVSTLSDTGETYDEIIGEKMGKPIKAPIAGKITSIKDGVIRMRGSDNKMVSINYYDYYPLNQSFINNDIIVKEGDTVKKGQLLAEGWQTKDGKLALGANTRVAYLPFKGYNYEDGIVISSSYAKKMTSEHMEDQIVSVRADSKGGVGSSIKKELSQYTQSPAIRKLDDDGIIKVGENVGPGDVIVATLRPIIRKKDMDSYGDSIEKAMAADKDTKYTYFPISIPPNSYQEGKVIRVKRIAPESADDRERIVVTITKESSLGIGDKVSGRHGNKGTITKILDDDEMPLAEDGKPIDLIFSPLAVPSRKNVGQLFEVNAGLIAEKTGKPFLVKNFDSGEVKRVEKSLEEIGFKDGKMKVQLREKQEDGTIKSIETENPVTVGNMYIMKLKHRVDDKVQSRDNLSTAPSAMNFMPSKAVGAVSGGRKNPQRMGEMEFWSLQSRGAVHNMLENSTIKSDGGGDSKQRMAIFNALSTGNLDGLEANATPGSLNQLSDSLKALGLNLRPTNDAGKTVSLNEAFSSISVDPMKTEDIIKSIGLKNEVTNPSLTSARAYKVDEEGNESSGVTTKGGLYDEEIFGKDFSDESRKNWGLIRLKEPVLNPIMLNNKSNNPYAILTGKSSQAVKDIVNGSLVVIRDPSKYFGDSPFSDSEIREMKQTMKKHGLKDGDTIDSVKLRELSENGESMYWQGGGVAIKGLLEDVNINKTLKDAQSELSKAKKIEDIRKAHNKVRTIESLVNRNMEAKDLITEVIPVAPKYLRPSITNHAKGDIIVDDLNKLYSEIIEANQPLNEMYILERDEKTKEVLKAAKDPFDVYEPDLYGSNSKNLYEAVAALSGYATRTDKKTKTELRSISDSLGGKHGLIRDSMLGKSLDFSGRSVIGVDPTLGLNQAVIPMDMAKNLYKPFIIKELVSSGVAKNQKDAFNRVNNLDSSAKKAIFKVVKERPIQLNRQPSLHGVSIQAFDTIVKEYQDGEKVRSIQINPLVNEAFNADFDGDQMAAHVPITESARLEAIKLMKPSENLINPTNGKMIVTIRHEMALGIYYLTKNSAKGEGAPKQYGSYSQLIKDYRDRKIGTDEMVSLNSTVATAGSHLFNEILPFEYRNYTKTWNKKEIENMFTTMYQEADKENFANRSKLDISNMIDKVKDLGFEASTLSGVSIGSQDFKVFSNVGELLNTNLEKFKDEKDEELRRIKAYQGVEKDLEKQIKNHALGENNPLDIMMSSGARGNPGQIRRMLGTVGVGKDVNDRLVDPIGPSHTEGLATWEFFKHSKDSRKGIFDRAVSTSEPGALTRNLYNATQDVVVKEEDCKTEDGVIMNPSNSSLVGRVAAKDILGSGRRIIVKKGEIISKEKREELFKDDAIKGVEIRSPIKCKTVGGICATCYGTTPGSFSLVKVGTAVGTIAAQAMGEPTTQMTMNTFHGGGTASGATIGLPRVQSILDLSPDKVVPSTLAKVSGTVESIIEGPTSDVITIGGVEHKVSKSSAKSINVSIGDAVKRGDFLTIGSTEDILNNTDGDLMFTNADPVEMFKLRSLESGSNTAAYEVADYLTNTMEDAFVKTVGDGAIDRRHLEVITSRMSSAAIVLDGGDSPYRKGQELSKQELEKWNELNSTPFHAKSVPVQSKDKVIDRRASVHVKNSDGELIVKAGDIITDMIYDKLVNNKINSVSILPKPIEYEVMVTSNLTTHNSGTGSENWFTNMGARAFRKELADGVVLGKKDTLQTPRSGLMVGQLQNIGEGFGASEAEKNTKTSIKNFFKNPKKQRRGFFGF